MQRSFYLWYHLCVYINGAGACTSISCPIFFSEAFRDATQAWIVDGDLQAVHGLSSLWDDHVFALDSCWAGWGVEASNHSLDDGNSRFIMLIYGHWPRKRLAKVVSVFLLVSAATWALPDAPYSNPIRVDWKDVYFYSKLPLVDPSGSQTIIHSQNGGTILQLPLSEYFSEELEDANGRLEGVLHLVEKRTTAPKVRDFT